jgi:DNA adenine methylase
MVLPLDIPSVGVPPIKCQGIKTKLIPFILSSIRWDSGEQGRWIEPFLGSGCVAFNLRPERALLADTNRHIVQLYRDIEAGTLTGEMVRDYLTDEGKRLETGGADYYYAVRERFNNSPTSLDFLFLNRSCFNGVMRFNRHGKFNVPFGHKPERFAKAYVTKIVNQVGWAARQMQGRDWEFRVARWEDTLASARTDDFVYLDPPYVGRHTDYFNTWDDTEAVRLANTASALPCGYALSMWLENRYRRNEHLEKHWSNTELRVCTHFYHVGSDESLRNEMDEALVIRQGFATTDRGKQQTKRKPIEGEQLSLALEKQAAYLAESIK